VTQAVEYPPSKQEALSSSTSMEKSGRDFKRTEGVAQVLEFLPSKDKALSSIPLQKKKGLVSASKSCENSMAPCTESLWYDTWCTVSS
jgi:hypothetical protein